MPSPTPTATPTPTEELVARLEALKAQVWTDTNLGLVELKDKFQELVSIIHAAFTPPPPAAKP